MPAIRLADIPNAPSGFNASGININAPRQARLGSISLAPIGLASQGIQVGSPNLGSVGIEAPEYAQLGQNANADPNALIGAARQMQQESLDPSDFNASAKVMEGMAKSIQLAGQFADNWTDKFLEAKNSSDIAKAETFLRSVYEKQSADQVGKPPEKWEEIWKENLETARKGLSEIKASPAAHEAMQMTFQRWQDISTFDIARKARVEQVNGMKMDMTSNALMKAANGDYEGAIMTMRESVKKGIHSEQEASLFGARLQDNIVRKAKEQRNADVASATLNDPIAAERDLEDVVVKGKPSNLFPGLTDKADQVRAYDAARAEATRYRQRLDDDALDMILTGQLSTEKDVRNFVGDALPEQQVLPLLKALSDTPVQREKALSLRPMVYAMADTYNPDNDDENRSEYFKIRDTIFQLPSDQREEPLALLRKARDEKADPTPLNVAKGQLKDLFDAGQFGSWEVGDDKKPKNEQEWNKYIEAGRKYAGHKSSLESWAKNNPREASSPDKVYEQFNRNLTYERQMQKYQQEKTRFRWFWEDAAPVAPPAPPINPDDVMQKIKSKSSFTPKATKKQIMDEVQKIDFETPLPDMSGVTS
jgi:hypothetical protein